MKYDGRHFYEDNIMPTEEAYDKYGSSIPDHVPFENFMALTKAALDG